MSKFITDYLKEPFQLSEIQKKMMKVILDVEYKFGASIEECRKVDPKFDPFIGKRITKPVNYR